MAPVYRILTAGQWGEARQAGALLPSPLDIASGYLHLSAASELLETADRYFSEATEPLALEIDAASLGDTLRWEPVATRGGALFPHVYAPQIALEAVVAVVPLERDEAGHHRLGARALWSTSRR